MGRIRPLLIVSVSSELKKRIFDDAAGLSLPRSHVAESRLRIGYGMPPCDYTVMVPCKPRKSSSKLLGMSISPELHERICQEEEAEPDKSRSRLVENRLRIGYGMPLLSRKARRNA